jgi:acid phosphatase
MRCSALAIIAVAAVANAANVPGKAFDRFFTIWLENQVSTVYYYSRIPIVLTLRQDYTKVADDGDMKEIAKQGILLTEYFAHTHPSQPNYVASVGGDYFGLNHDDFVQIPANVSTVVDLLDTRNIDWKGYFEHIPGPGYMGPGTQLSDHSGWDYVRKHK